MMMDLSEKGSGSGSETNSSSTTTTTTKKSCSDCQTSKTPLWRGGPDGPKSLCNACGIRYRKKRRALLGIKKEGSVETKKKDRRSDNHHQSNDHNNNKKLGASLKLRLLAFGREVLLQRSSMLETQQIQLGEEEQAAVLLMALSCGSVSA